MLEFPYPCQIISRSTTGGTIDDGYGNLTPTLGTIDSFCDLQQTSRTEPPLSGETSITTWNIYLPVDTVIDTGDAVVVNNKVYELIGDPWNADSGSNMVNHVEATATLQGGV